MSLRLQNPCHSIGKLDYYGWMDYTKSEIIKLCTREQVNQTTAIRNIAKGAAGKADAGKRGNTPARIATLSAAYTKVMNAPRGQILNRSAPLKEVVTDATALVEFMNDMDDLVLQFGTPPHRPPLHGSLETRPHLRGCGRQ